MRPIVLQRLGAPLRGNTPGGEPGDGLVEEGQDGGEDDRVGARERVDCVEWLGGGGGGGGGGGRRHIVGRLWGEGGWGVGSEGGGM